MRNTLIVDELWKYVTGTKRAPTKPLRPNDAVALHTQEQYEQDAEAWMKEQETFEDKYLLACAYIGLVVEPEVKIHLSGIINSCQAMKVLKNLYSSKDRASMDTFYANITRSTQDQFKSIYKYS